MILHRPLLAVAVLASIAVLAVAQVQEQAPPDQGTDLRSSNCYKCPATGGGNLGPPLQSMLSVTAGGSTALALNQPLNLTVTVHNDWVAALRDLSADLDLGGAP